MTRYLLDTNAAARYIGDLDGVRAAAKLAVGRGHRIGIAMPVLAELWLGIERSAARERNAKALRRNLADWTVWPFDAAAAERYGQVAATQRRLGRPIGVMDMQIAAIALSLPDCVVVTSDADMSAVPGLAVVDWRSG